MRQAHASVWRAGSHRSLLAVGFPLLAALAPVLAAGVGGAATLIGANQTNKANAREAEINRDFQELMSRTAHQREVADLRAAGLNPILSTRGSGAPQPGGGQATMTDEIGPAVGQGISTAMQASQLRSQLETMDVERYATGVAAGRDEAERKLALEKANTERVNQAATAANEDLTRADIVNRSRLGTLIDFQSLSERERPPQIRSQTDVQNQERELKKIQTEIEGHSAKGMENFSEIEASTFGRIMRYIDRLRAHERDFRPRR